MERKEKNKSSDIKMGLTKKQRSWVYSGTILALIILFFIVNNLNGEPEEGPYPPDYKQVSAQELKSAPDFALKSVDGKIIKLSEYKGKVVFIDFWATWCGPCRKGIPDLIELKKEFGAKGFEVIGISVDDKEKLQQVPSFVKDMKINYPVVYADAKVISDFGGIANIPTAFIIDKQGKIAANYIGNYPKETYAGEINKLLKK